MRCSRSSRAVPGRRSYAGSGETALRARVSRPKYTVGMIDPRRQDLSRRLPTDKAPFGAHGNREYQGFLIFVGPRKLRGGVHAGCVSVTPTEVWGPPTRGHSRRDDGGAENSECPLVDSVGAEALADEDGGGGVGVHLDWNHLVEEAAAGEAADALGDHVFGHSVQLHQRLAVYITLAGVFQPRVE
jgi:hypothetical protein